MTARLLAGEAVQLWTVSNAAVEAPVSELWRAFPVTRLGARCLAWEPVGACVLEVKGFELERVRPGAMYRVAELTDESGYSCFRDRTSNGGS